MGSTGDELGIKYHVHRTDQKTTAALSATWRQWNSAPTTGGLANRLGKGGFGMPANEAAARTRMLGKYRLSRVTERKVTAPEAS